MNKQSVTLPGSDGQWGSYISKYQPDSSQVLDNMFTANSKNFVTDQTGMIDKRQGGVEWSRTVFGQPAKDTYEAVFESGERHFLRVGGGVLSASTGTGLFDTITSGFASIGNFEWATYKNRSYGCNGVNAAQTYDIATSYGGVSYIFTTAKTKLMGAQAPVTAPTAGAPTAGGAIPVGSHTYKVTFMYYDFEESNGSPSSAVQTTTAGNQTIALTTIPIGGYGVTARRIYRDNNDGSYLLLATLGNNTATTYLDTLAVGSTPTPMPLFNDTPPTFSKIALWQDSLFIAPVGETNGIRYSNPGEPDIYDPDNFIICQSDDVVTALYVYNGKLYVFGLHSFGSIEGTTPDTYYYRNISNLIGCVDNRSIQVRSIVSVPTLWWLSDKGFYYSNGSTVEYGSDYIQDLVNLNIAQVNYSTNKNTQSSLADFSGDTSSPGIDLATSPGSIRTINPTRVWSTQADWDGGSSLTNIATGATNQMSVPTQQTPAFVSGTSVGTVEISGTLRTPVISDFTGTANVTSDGSPPGGSGVLQLVDNPNTGSLTTRLAQAFYPSYAGTVTDISFINRRTIAYTYSVQIWSDSLGQPSSLIGSFSNITVPAGSGDITQTTVGSVAVSGATRYWIVVTILSAPGFDNDFYGKTGYRFSTDGLSQPFLDFRSSWVFARTSAGTQLNSMGCSFTFVQSAIAAVGTWTGPTYDSLSTSTVGASITHTGVFPAGTSSVTTIEAAANSSFTTGLVTQAFPNLSGLGVVTLLGKRFWRIKLSLSTTDNRFTAQIGPPALKFNITGTWESQPVDTTTDNVAWGTLTYTGNTPLGTTVTLTIATATLIGGPYSAYGPIGSALVQQFAKVRATLVTTSDNATSPTISSITLNWTVTSTITSSAIDTGTTPAGFGTFQWEQISFGVGVVTAEVRTATTAPGLTSATFVSVMNGEFPALTALQFVQWRLTITSTPNLIPEITSVTINWLIPAGTVGVRCASIFFNKTYYISVATTGATANNTLIQLDQFGKWRIQKDASIGTFLSYFNSLYFTDGITGSIYNGFIAVTDNGTPIVMDVRTKAWSANNDLFLKVPRALKVTGINTGTDLHAYYSTDRGETWIELLNESGTTGFQTDDSGTEFVVLFVPDALTLESGRTLMYRLVSEDEFPCSIINYVPSFYARKGRYLSNA